MMHSLTVYFNHHSMAQLTLDPKKERYHLMYTPQWQKEGHAISPYLPLDSSAPSGSVRRFLENLLPEGRGLDDLIRSMHVSRSNIFGLIQAIGFESSGALSFAQESEKTESRFRPITEEELTSRIDEIESRSITIWDKKQRLSLAGVQEKLPVLYQEGQIGLADGRLSSTHILKFQTQRTQHIVINEYYCMTLAKACGLQVADVKLKRYGEHPVLMVTRFDRKVHDEGIERLHLIDGCQLLDLPPAYKYERSFGAGRDVKEIREGVSFKKLFEATRFCDVPATSKLLLLDWAILNLIIGNADAHGKNISFFVDKRGLHVAPYYDLLSIILHEGVDHELAMAYGDEFHIDKVMGYPLRAFCEETGLHPRLVSQRIGMLCGKVEKMNSVGLMDGIQFQKEEMEFMKRLQKLIQTRTVQLKIASEEMLKVSWE